MDGQWTYHNFRGNSWMSVNSPEKRLYQKNAYRVLLTRARQGMIIFVPRGDERDKTRKPEFYDGIYAYLQEVGVEEV